MQLACVGLADQVGCFDCAVLYVFVFVRLCGQLTASWQHCRVCELLHCGAVWCVVLSGVVLCYAVP